MRISNFTFFLAFLFLSSNMTSQVCYDASLTTPVLTPSDPAILGAPLVMKIEFCNDEDALPLDPQGALRIQISESKLALNGNPTNPAYFTASYGFATWTFTQNATLPAMTCDTISIPYIVSMDAFSSLPSIGVNANITPSGIMTGNDNCFTPDDDNASAFTYTIDNTTVPVELISFEARKDRKSSLLAWQTANEINNSHFEVEASSDGSSFKNIGKVEGTNSVEKSNYSFTDRNPLIGVNYYRLKQVDFDGRFDYTDVKSVSFDTDLAQRTISVFPNPVVDYVRIDAGTTDMLNVRIYDMVGNLVMYNSIESGRNIDTAELASGVYLIKVLDTDNEVIGSERIIISK